MKTIILNICFLMISICGFSQSKEFINTSKNPIKINKRFLCSERFGYSGHVIGAPGKNPGGVRILDRLRDEQRINSAQYESIFHQAKRSGERVEEWVIQSGVMSEADLLEFVAAMYQTRFVSTHRLAKAQIEPGLLELLPRRIAERAGCFPLAHDKRAQNLSIVAIELDEVVRNCRRRFFLADHDHVFVDHVVFFADNAGERRLHLHLARFWVYDVKVVTVFAVCRIVAHAQVIHFSAEDPVFFAVVLLRLFAFFQILFFGVKPGFFLCG